MRKGWVALMDALGFKGIWRRYPPDEVIAKLKTFEEGARRMMASSEESINALHGSVVMHHASVFLSDSVFIAASVDPNPRLSPEFAALLSVASACATLIAFSAANRYPIAYRGCVAYDEY